MKKKSSWKAAFPWLNSPLQSFAKQVDFVKLVRRIAQEEPGATYMERPDALPPAFDNQADIARLAVDLAERALAEKGEHVSRKELESQVDIISCRYDAELHHQVKGATFNIVSQLFESRDINHLLVSADGRELRHLEALHRAKAAGHGVVYLINHSSHWDEFIFNVFLDQNNLDLPLFAAGQNMMATPSLTTLFMVGSYVIVRSGAGRSYLSTLFHYCQAIAELGKDQGIFLEAWSGGARTRDGSLRYPRRLIALQGALAARNDIYVQPVVISYSRVPEDLGLSENRGIQTWINGHHMFREFFKKPWTPLRSAVRGLKGVYGRTYVGFAEGKLLSELSAKCQEENSDLTIDEYVSLHAIKEIARDKKIMATQLAARSFMKAKKRADLTIAAEEALDEIRDYHLRTFNQEPDIEDFYKDHGLVDFLKDGLESLRRRKVIGSFRPLSGKLPKVLAPHALSYYATHGDRRLYSPSAKENFVICGANPGGFGLAFFLGQRMLADRKFHNSSLTFYDPEEESINSLVYERTLPEYFPNHRLPKNVFPTGDHLAAFRKATEVIITASPGRVENILKTVFASAPDLRSLIIASRGFDKLSHRLPMQMAWEAAVAAGRPDLNILALSGPFTAADLLDEKGGLWILAGKVGKGKESEARLFSYGKYRVHLCPDPIGVETAAALADAYTIYGAILNRQADFRSRPAAVAGFVREISAETKGLALALGGQPQTFEADNPAWVAEFLVKALSIPENPTARLLANKGAGAIKASLANDDIWPDSGVSGFYSIHSAYLTAKHLGLSLPHLEAANRLFWG